jgi:hypothetical protein
MTRLGVPSSRVDHVIASKDPAVLAFVVEELQRGVLNLEKPKKTVRKPSSDTTN